MRDMGSHELDDTWRDTIAQYALGSASAADAAAFETHLAEPCLVCRVELRAVRSSLDALALTAKPVPPPPAVFEKLMAFARPKVSADGVQTWKQWPADFAANEDSVLLRGDPSAFQPTAIPGIEARRLFVDTTRDVITMLVRMAPGTSYPPHRHGNVEECYVLSGDLTVGEGVTMHTGDYQRMEKDSEHPTQWTKDGCTLLLLSSRHDVLLA